MVRPTPTTVAVVLAAGGATRFGPDPGAKLTAEIDGRRIAARAIDAAVDASIGPVLVVTGPVPLERLYGVDRHHDVREVANPDWALGQATSLRAAIDAADAAGADAVVVGLADQPFVTPEAWRLVAASRSPIAVATYGGHLRNPVRLARGVWALVPSAGDEGARSLVRLRPDLVEEIPCPGSPDDIDTVEDLRRWQNRSSTNSP